MSNAYERILKDIDNKIFTNLDIALMSIMYWIIKSPGMTTEHLEDIMTRIGYAFDITTMALSDGTNSYTVLQMLEHTVNNVYVNTSLSPEMLALIINKCVKQGYINLADAQTLIDSLSEA